MESTEKNTVQTQKEAASAIPEENKIAILGHNVFSEDNANGVSNIVIELSIKNVMNRMVGSVVFRSRFY